MTIAGSISKSVNIQNFLVFRMGFLQHGPELGFIMQILAFILFSRRSKTNSYLECDLETMKYMDGHASWV